MSSSEDEGAGQAVCIDEGEENRQILQGNVCVFKTNLLSMQNEAIVLRSKKVQSNFVRNEMYYGKRYIYGRLVSSRLRYSGRAPGRCHH